MLGGHICLSPSLDSFMYGPAVAWCTGWAHFQFSRLWPQWPVPNTFIMVCLPHTNILKYLHILLTLVRKKPSVVSERKFLVFFWICIAILRCKGDQCYFICWWYLLQWGVGWSEHRLLHLLARPHQHHWMGPDEPVAPPATDQQHTLNYASTLW